MAKWNPLILLGAGAALLYGIAKGRKSGNGSGRVKDVTDTLPTHVPGEGGEAPTEPEQAFVDIALDEQPVSFFLGQPGIDQGVVGIGPDGFVHPADYEWRSGWLSRVAYWGAYPYAEGHPLQLPPSCVAAVTCPEDLQPYRNAMLRIMDGIRNGMTVRGIKDERWNPDKGKWGP